MGPGKGNLGQRGGSFKRNHGINYARVEIQCQARRVVVKRAGLSAVHPYFEAHAFHPSLGNEVVNGKIYFTGRILRFQSEDVSLEIPLKRLEVNLGEGDDERMFFSDPEQPGLQIIAPDQSLLECQSLPQVESIRKRLEAQLGSGELRRRLKVVLYFSVACCLFAWLAVTGTGLMVRAIVNRISPEWERQFGDGLVKELKGEMKFVNDTNRIARLAETAAPLLKVLPANGTQYHFYIVEDDEPNAFALPGGHIIVMTGLLKLTDRPEELLGVIAHEVAHVTEKHGIREQIASAGPFLIFQVFLRGRGGAAGLLVGGSALLVSQGFSQEYEMEADDVGWQYLVKANIDPRGMAEIFRKLKAYEEKQPKFLDAPQAFSSHPATNKRIARLDKKWNKLSRKSGFIELKPPDPKAK